MAVAKISFQWLIRSEWVCRYVCELQLLYLDAPQFPHSASANSTPLLIPFFVGVCSFTKWCHATMQASLFLSTSMIWSDVSIKSHFYGLFYGSFLAHIVIIILSKRILLRPYRYSFIIHQVGADHSDVISASVFCVWVSEGGLHRLISHSVVFLAGIF